MWIAATCTNPECPENGIAKPGEFDAAPEAEFVCGYCQQPCTIELDVTPPPPPPDTLSLQDRVTALEEFNATLVAALSSIFNPADAADGSQFAALIGQQ